MISFSSTASSQPGECLLLLRAPRSWSGLRLRCQRNGKGGAADQGCTWPGPQLGFSGRVTHLRGLGSVVDRPTIQFPDYEILAEVGRGTTGIVYRAQCVRLHRVVALKVLLPSLACEAQARRRFLREARILANLTRAPDPNFPALHAVGGDDARPYHVREFVEGETLEQRVAARSISPREGIRVLA